MSEPKAPFYYKRFGGIYHWETSCSKNRYPDPAWIKTYTKPASRKECQECKAKLKSDKIQTINKNFL